MVAAAIPAEQAVAISVLAAVAVITVDCLAVPDLDRRAIQAIPDTVPAVIQATAAIDQGERVAIRAIVSAVPPLWAALDIQAAIPTMAAVRLEFSRDREVIRLIEDLPGSITTRAGWDQALARPAPPERAVSSRVMRI